MTWTRFMDMHSGGGNKEPWDKILIEAPEEEAKVIFYNRFGHNPERVTCTCCGEDYSVSSEESLALLTGYDRNCDNLETPRGQDGRYEQPDDPWFKAHYYLEPGEEEEARERGYGVKENIAKEVARSYPESIDKYRYLTLAEYLERDDVLAIHAEDITPEQRVGDVPEQGYVWAG